MSIRILLNRKELIWISEMTLTLIIILIILGLFLIVVEALVVPGTTFVGIAGFILIIAAIWGIFKSYGNTVGFISIGAIAVTCFIIFYFSLKGETWKKFSLKTSIDGKVNIINEDIKVGVNGKTISRLAPMGKAIINNNYYEVTSLGEYIDENKEITVIKIEGNKIYVKLQDEIKT